MFWNDPTLYGATLPYKDVPLQTPFVGNFFAPWQNVPRIPLPPMGYPQFPQFPQIPQFPIQTYPQMTAFPPFLAHNLPFFTPFNLPFQQMYRPIV